jgi:hypothetical protein
MCGIIIMGDKFVFDSSMYDEVVEDHFTKKRWLYCQDSNNNNYDSGQVMLDTTTLANSGMFMDYKQAVLQIPVIVTLSSKDDVINWTSINAEYMAGLKNGHHQLIHKMSVDYNNTNILPAVDFTNAYVSYKLMNTMCENDLETVGPSIGFYPDDAKSWAYAQNRVTAFGHGSVNNNNFVSPIIPSLGWQTNQLRRGNSGFLKRQDATSVSIPGTTSALTTETLQGTSVNNVVKKNLRYQSLYIMAEIRLKDLHDYFAKIPLMKGSVYRFVFTTNQSSFQIQKSGTEDFGAQDLTRATSTKCGISFDPASLLLPSNGTNCMMIASCNGVNPVKSVIVGNPAGDIGDFDDIDLDIVPGYGAGSAAVSAGTILQTFEDAVAGVVPSAAVAPGSRIINCSVSIVKVSNSLQSYLNIPQFMDVVRLWVPGYDMDPAYHEQYLEKGTVQFNYTQIQNYNLMNLTSNSAFNKSITTGVRGLKKVIMIPFISGNINGAVTTPVIVNGVTLQPARGPFATYRSPFASEPATTSPLLNCFTGLNVRVGGQNQLPSDMLYAYEAFEQNLFGNEAISGNLVTGISSSLMNKERWKNNYQYYVLDCSRRLPEQNNLSMAVEVIGFVKSLVDIDVMVFLEFEQTIAFTILTGALAATK